MSDYTPTTDFSIKDSLITGDPNKIIKGSDFDIEFEAIETAILSKYDAVDITDIETKLDGFLSVVDYGADPTGVASSVTAFQDTIDSTTDVASVVVIHVPSGTYLGDLSTLTVGDRTIVWQEEGRVTYSTAVPVGKRINAKLAADDRPWFIGSYGFDQRETTTDIRPALRVFRQTSHTTTPTGVKSAFHAEIQINSDCESAETAGTFEVDEASGVVGTTNSNIVGIHAEGRKLNAGSKKHVWGANIVAKDQTTRKSSVSDGTGITAIECDCVASGPDDSGNRNVLVVIGREYDTSADGATQITNGIYVRPSQDAGEGPCELVTGIRVDKLTQGSITTGILVNASDTDIEIAHTGSYGELIIGSTDIDTGLVGNLLFHGADSLGNPTPYASIRGEVLDATNGSEDGALRFRTNIAGTLTQVVGFAPGITVGSPTGGEKGLGTINCAGDIYKNNTAYTNPDYVFEHHYTGDIVKFASNSGATEYQGRLDLDSLKRYTETNLRLPGISDEPMGMFERGDKVLEKLEELTLYILELHERIKELENK